MAFRRASIAGAGLILAGVVAFAVLGGEEKPGVRDGPHPASLLVGTALAGDRPDLERVPHSCRQLEAAKERCRLDGCNVPRMDRLRDLCKRDSTKAEQR